MNKWHQSSSQQVLATTPRQVYLAGLLRLQARRAGWIRVEAGAVWLTCQGDAADHVLAAGDRLWLGAGVQMLAEPWRAGEAVRLAWSTGAAAVPQPGRRGLRAMPGRAAVPGLAGPASPLLDAVWGGAWGAARTTAARGLRAVAGRLAAAARSAEAMASRAQGSICAGDSIASSGALQ